MSIIDYTMDEHVVVCTLNNGENRFNPVFLESFLTILDRIEKDTDATTLIVTSAHEKIFCNGIDLEWLIPVIQQQETAVAKDFFYTLNRLFKRVVNYPLITIAAINGHAFAGGAILSCAFDFRFMRSDRGYFCFPEVDLGIPFLPGMNALMKKAMPYYMVEEMEFTGVRLTAEECASRHIVKKHCHLTQLMPETLAFAKSINKKRAIVKEMKARLNRRINHAMDVEDVPYIESGKFNIG
jgi:enoyl-CoA hydratase/carnithine racemase